MIQTPSEIDCSKIEFGPVKVLDNGGKTVNLRYEGRNLIVETPSVGLPYGVNIFDKNGPPKYSVDLSFRGAEELQKFFEEFDERMVDAGVENAQKWWKMNNPSREVVKAFYTPVVKVSRDQQGNLKPYPPTFKVNLRKKKGADAAAPASNTFEAEMYNGAVTPLVAFDREMPVDQILAKRSNVTAIVQCTGVWFAGGKFGSTWKAVQFRVDSQPEQIRGPAFRSSAPDIRAFVKSQPKQVADEEFDEDEGEEEVVAAVLPKAGKAAAPVVVEDDEEEAEPVPVPKKVIKKVAPKAGK
jgi:hypothetical protein